jgi:hypothetical protein
MRPLYILLNVVKHLDGNDTNSNASDLSISSAATPRSANH